MDKQELREKYRQIRQAMAPRTVEDDSLAICRKVFREVDWDKTKKICTYDPIGKLKEVDVKPLLEAVEYKYPGIKIRKLRKLKKQPVPKTKFDLILVPCLAFDKDNYRLGWGSGYYDKFLAVQPQALKIGVCFQICFVEKLPHEAHDIVLDKIITEE
jgi:5-formyltetrahydrofolate cyclo-ligase